MRPDILRGRFEARPEVGYQFSDRFRIGVRAVFDLGTEPNSDNARNFDNYHSRGSTVQRYYLEAKPGDFTILAGAFGMPLAATEMFWDHDIQTPGVAVSYQTRVGGDSTLTVAGAGLYGPQSQGDQTRIGAGQVIWSVGDPSRLRIQTAVSFYYFDPFELKLFFADGRPNLIRQNYPNADLNGLLSNYRILDANVRVSFPIGRVPVFIGIDALERTSASRASPRRRGTARRSKPISRSAASARPATGVSSTFSSTSSRTRSSAPTTPTTGGSTPGTGATASACATRSCRASSCRARSWSSSGWTAQTWLNRILVDLVKMF